MKFKCEICKENREEHMIDVLSFDESKVRGLPDGTMTRNINYCKDSNHCHTEALRKMNISLVLE